MSLTTTEIQELAEAMNQEWDLVTLNLFADLLGFSLDNEAPFGSVRDRALVFITRMNSWTEKMNRLSPPRDQEMLEKLLVQHNSYLKNLAVTYLTPKFISPTGQARDAIQLGRAAFVDRKPLREVLFEFSHPSQLTTRVLIVRGAQPCGKSYSWEFIRHMAGSVGAIPQRLKLKDLCCSPRAMLERCFQLAGIDTTDMPKMADDPQLAKVEPMITWFKGLKLITIHQPHWLVIDDINHDSVTPELREAAYALAFCAEEAKANLWVILLGYNEPIIDSDLEYAGQEEPRFPDEQMVADYFVAITKDTSTPVSKARAGELGRLLLSRYPPVDKLAMATLKKSIEDIGAKLRQGLALIEEPSHE